MVTAYGRLLGSEEDAGGAHPTARTGAPPVPPAQREVFLDAIRAIAIVRVIAWHAFGVAAITYFVAAMPAMFFVSGSLLAKSMRRRPAPTVLADRFRRLLVPLWVFALAAWTIMATVAWHQGRELPLERAAAWFLPLTDPQGTEWEGGWLSSHLWYLRTLTWLLLASPLLIRAVRRRPGLTLSVPLVATFALDRLARDGALPFGHGLTWALGDLALYSVFFLAGALHRDGAFAALRRRGWLALAVLAGLAAVAWRLTQPVPLGVVNNSHPMHLFVGAAWLAVAMAAQGPLARLATAPLAGAAVRAIGRRSLTIYLWHTAAIIVAVNVLSWRRVEDGAAYYVGLVLLTLLGILVAVRAFGWVEDLAARRRPSRPAAPALAALLPRRIAVGTVAATAAALLVTASSPRVATPVMEAAAEAVGPGRGGQPGAARRPPVPSRPPPAPVFVTPAPLTDVAGPPPPVPGDLAARLDAELADWAAHNQVNGVLAGLAVGPDVHWTGATGARPETGAAVRATDAVELASLTKLFTAALVYRAADVGLIDIWAPLPWLVVLPDFPYEEGITVRHLLEHSSGLVNYRDTALYELDPALISDPVSAVRASLAEDRFAPPGAVYEYSSTNFLLLGLLLEQVTGRSFGDLLREELIEPLGLRSTFHRPPAPGEPRGATAGVITTLPDLLRAGVAILRDHAGLTERSHATMTTIDVETGYGPGTFGFCPCRLDDYGVPRFSAVGYYGATTLLAYLPALDMTLAVDLVDSLWEDDQYAPVADLIERIERLVREP